MSTKQKVIFAFASLCLLATIPASANDGYYRPRGYAPHQPPVYAYQPPVVYRPPPVYYRPWPPFEPEYYWRRHRHHHERGW